MTVLMCGQNALLDLSRETYRRRPRRITGLLLPLEAGGAIDVPLARRAARGPGGPSVEDLQKVIVSRSMAMF